MSRAFGRIFLAAIFLLVVGQSIHAATGNKTKKLNELTTGQVVKIGGVSFVKTASSQLVATSWCPQGSSYSSFYKGCVVKTTDFAYTGSEQTFTAPVDGYYVLEVWGSQGGGTGQGGVPGYGGYAIGITKLNYQENIYIYVGGQKTYNGGGSGSGKGGGATHVAFVTGVLSTLSNQQNQVLVVAGGGGGAEWGGTLNGNGGGYLGNSPGQYNKFTPYIPPTGGTQTNGGSAGATYGQYYGGPGEFGQGGTGVGKPNGDNGPGGGGGWYGGGGVGEVGIGAGGSGYIGSSSLLNTRWELRHMTCCECATSTEETTYTVSNTCANSAPTADCAKTGNGAARITQLSVYLGI